MIGPCKVLEVRDLPNLTVTLDLQLIYTEVITDLLTLYSMSEQNNVLHCVQLSYRDVDDLNAAALRSETHVWPVLGTLLL